ncbi:Homeodomain-like domain-containing protein [Laceyella sacchari]|nr:Homeodomain-like domain-containing protein [Laceyella sacchari]
MAKGKYQEWLTEEALLLLEGWARDGLTDEQIAHNMGISVRALYQWKKKYVQIFQALKKGKEVVDRQVENALLKSALGYHYEEEALTNKGEVVTLRKYQPPNTTAAIFWLKNRKPVDWRDKVITEHEGKIEHEIVVEWGGSSGVSDNED